MPWIFKHADKSFLYYFQRGDITFLMFYVSTRMNVDILGDKFLSTIMHKYL